MNTQKPITLEELMKRYEQTIAMINDRRSSRAIPKEEHDKSKIKTRDIAGFEVSLIETEK